MEEHCHQAWTLKGPPGFNPREGWGHGSQGGEEAFETAQAGVTEEHREEGTHNPLRNTLAGDIGHQPRELPYRDTDTQTSPSVSTSSTGTDRRGPGPWPSVWGWEWESVRKDLEHGQLQGVPHIRDQGRG